MVHLAERTTALSDPPQRSESAGHALEEQLLSGKFQIERIIGRGGMGAVFVATHVLTKRTGALKLLDPSHVMVKSVLERFVREASAAALIDNRHIIETYDAGRLETGQPYIFMELLPGEPLDAWLKARGSCSISEAIEIAAQAAEGLAAAHRAGVIHRDIKPSNLFLVGKAEPFVKILDFGISKFSAESSGFEPRLTAEGAVFGTPLYMSPEQVMGHRDVDARSDVYSLGAVLYELLCGQPPYNGETLMQLGTRICAGECAPLDERRPGIPEALVSIVHRALGADKESRFANCEEFSVELRRFQLRPASEPGHAEPDTTPFKKDAFAMETIVPDVDSSASADPKAPKPNARSSSTPVALNAPASVLRPSKRKAQWAGAAFGLVGVLVLLRSLSDRSQVVTGNETRPSRTAASSDERIPSRIETRVQPLVVLPASAHAAAPAVSATTAAVGHFQRQRTGPSSATSLPLAPAASAERELPPPLHPENRSRPLERSVTPAARDGLLQANPFRRSANP